MTEATNKLPRMRRCLEGPCIDTYRSGTRQLWPDLGTAPAMARWPVFTVEVDSLDVRALFAFPVATGQITVGVLELYRATTGRLGPAEQQSGLACAAAINHMIATDMDRLAAAEDGDFTSVDSAGEEFSRAVIFNAAGIGRGAAGGLGRRGIGQAACILL